MRLILIVIFSILNISISAQVLSLREQSRVTDEILSERLDRLLPVLMDRNAIDMWVVISLPPGFLQEEPPCLYFTVTRQKSH
jgi:hypothetical protein